MAQTTRELPNGHQVLQPKMLHCQAHGRACNIDWISDFLRAYKEESKGVRMRRHYKTSSTQTHLGEFSHFLLRRPLPWLFHVYGANNYNFSNCWCTTRMPCGVNSLEIQNSFEGQIIHKEFSSLPVQNKTTFAGQSTWHTPRMCQMKLRRRSGGRCSRKVTTGKLPKPNASWEQERFTVNTHPS